MQRSTRNFEIRRQVLRVKKNDEIQKEHTHASLSISLYLLIRRCTSERMCMHQSLYLSLSLCLHLQKRFGFRSYPNGTQERMFRQYKILCMLLKVRKADAHDKMGFQYIHWPVPRGTGVRGIRPPSPENHKNIEYLSNTGPDLLKFSKLPSQHSTLGHHRHPSETPFKWRFAGGPMMARF